MQRADRVPVRGVVAEIGRSAGGARLAHRGRPRGHQRERVAIRNLFPSAIALAVKGQVERERCDPALLQRTPHRLRHSLLVRREAVQQEHRGHRRRRRWQQQGARDALGAVHQVEQPFLAARRTGGAPRGRGEVGTSHAARYAQVLRRTRRRPGGRVSLG